MFPDEDDAPLEPEDLPEEDLADADFLFEDELPDLEPDLLPEDDVPDFEAEAFLLAVFAIINFLD
jgi:hypothetical protein